VSQTPLTLHDRLAEVVDIHFDRRHGTPFWLDKADSLGIRPASDICTVDDLRLFGPMEVEALRRRPIEDFIPRRYRRQRHGWIVGETGGTTGVPKTTMYLEEEFHAAFIEPFVIAAACRNFPKGENWLWIGPSGPHLIGKAARLCATALESADPFAIDFDPRWVKKFPQQSLAFSRYLAHVLEQAMRIIATQRIGVLFSTPKVLLWLAETMDEQQRLAIGGIHFGGMTLERAAFQQIGDAFPKAVMIAGYGNTLFGMCPEFMGDPDLPLEYFPVGNRLILQTVPIGTELTSAEKLFHPGEAGETGQIVCSRLDKSFLIINLFERDQGQLVEPSAACLELGIGGNGLRNPAPMARESSGEQVAIGLY
jgi:thienamycin biosynthesis protein ThnN